MLTHIVASCLVQHGGDVTRMDPDIKQFTVRQGEEFAFHAAGIAISQSMRTQAAQEGWILSAWKFDCGHGFLQSREMAVGRFVCIAHDTRDIVLCQADIGQFARIQAV